MPNVNIRMHDTWIAFMVAIVGSVLFTIFSAPHALAAAVLVQSAHSNTNGGSSPASVTLGSTATAGNLLVAICGYNGSSTLSVPTGFTAAINQMGTISQAIFYKVAAGNETTVSCPFTGNGGTGIIMLHEFSGIRTLAPLDAVNTVASTGSSSTASSGSVTTTNSNDLLIAGMIADSSNTPGSWTSSFSTILTGASGGKPVTRASYGSGYLSASSTGTYNSTITIGSGNWRGQIAAFKEAPPALLSTSIVDGSGATIANPSVTFPTLNRSFSCVTNTGQLSSTSQKIRVTNTTNNPNWSLSIAPTAGGSARWTTGGGSPKYYDFNDAGGVGCTDGDSDGYAGQLSVVPTGASIVPQSGCSSSGVSLLGSTTGFTGSSAITLASAGSGAEYYCYWDLVNLSLSQKLPPSQPAGTYSLGLTITVVAN